MYTDMHQNNNFQNTRLQILHETGEVAVHKIWFGTSEMLFTTTESSPVAYLVPHIQATQLKIPKRRASL